MTFILTTQFEIILIENPLEEKTLHFYFVLPPLLNFSHLKDLLGGRREAQEQIKYIMQKKTQKLREDQVIEKQS